MFNVIIRYCTHGLSYKHSVLETVDMGLESFMCKKILINLFSTLLFKIRINIKTNFSFFFIFLNGSLPNLSFTPDLLLWGNRFGDPRKVWGRSKILGDKKFVENSLDILNTQNNGPSVFFLKFEIPDYFITVSSIKQL